LFTVGQLDGDFGLTNKIRSIAAAPRLRNGTKSLLRETRRVCGWLDPCPASHILRTRYSA
jgi:hypothetical protein